MKLERDRRRIAANFWTRYWRLLVKHKGNAQTFKPVIAKLWADNERTLGEIVHERRFYFDKPSHELYGQTEIIFRHEFIDGGK